MTYSNDYYQPKLFQLGYTDVNRPDFEWLNDDSRLFLQRGYLLEGTTALERIRFIA